MGRKKKQENDWFYIKSTVKFFRDEKVKFFIAVFALLFSILLLISFLSFFFTWSSDCSKLSMSWFDLVSDKDIQVENWVGKTGAALSKVFIHDWFGVPSFALIFLIVLSSFKLIGIELLKYKKTLIHTLLIMIWSSIFLGFLFDDLWDANLGGAHGYYVSSWLNASVGKFGTFVLLLITCFAFLVFTIDDFVEKIREFWKKTTSGEVKLKIPIKMPFTIVKNAKKAGEDTVQENDEDEDEDEEEDEDIEDEDDEIIKNQKNKIKAQQNGSKLNPIIQNKTTIHKEFILDDTGKERPLGLGFEVEDTLQRKEETLEIKKNPEITPVESQDNSLAFRVEKNEDVNLDDNFPIESFDPTLELRDYQYPTFDLLEEHGQQEHEVSNEELLSNKNKIVETLGNYKIEIIKIKATIGPTITLYEIVPAPGIRISKIKNLEDDIALSLSALGIRIIAPMPGRGTIGIEVPNLHPQIVSMKSVISSAKFQSSKFELPIALGKTISNETFVADLAKMPHLLVAGATGQGKSVGLNAIIASLLYKKHPSQLKFVLVDPKKVELNIYETIEKHFLAKLPDAEEAIITDNQKVIYTLSSLNVEMDVRYNLLKDAQVRQIKEYNEKFVDRKLNPLKGHRYLPYIVLVIDEFADLIMTAGKEVELPIARLAQLARAVGIHLIVATQRPSTNIITGVIKANFPTRIAFKVASMIDSRTILDSPGANQLVGRGDMLITQGSDLIRLQCAFIDTKEIEQIVQFIGNQRGYPTPMLLPEYETDEKDDSNSFEFAKRDELFEEAARIVVMNQQGSTSLIQRKMSIGYNRAGRIMDQLEATGIVGPFEGSKARRVLYVDDLSLEQFLSTLR